MSFTSCTTGTVARFTGELYMPVEAWDDEGTPYVADQYGLATVEAFTHGMANMQFITLMTAAEAAQEQKEAAEERARVRSRMSVKEIQKLGKRAA